MQPEEVPPWTDPPLDPVQLINEIEQLQGQIMELVKSIHSLGVPADFTAANLAVTLNTIMDMLFTEGGVLYDRRNEFKWRLNRQMLEMVRSAYRQGVAGKLNINQHFQP